MTKNWLVLHCSVHGSQGDHDYMPSIWHVSLTGIVEGCYIERALSEHRQPPRAPFDGDDTDVIFRSCDGVDFRLHKSIITRVSPVWRDMLAPLDSKHPVTGTPQAVTLTEDTETLDNLLRFCYPISRPQFTSLGDACEALHAASKYRMYPIILALKESLLLFLNSEPLRVYCIAYMYRCGDVAQMAAARLLQDPSFADPLQLPPPPEFETVPAIALCAFVTYRRKCIQAAQAAFEDHEWMHSGCHSRRFSGLVEKDGVSNTWVWLTCTTCSENTRPMSIRRRGIDYVVYPREWWQKYFDAAERELSQRPLGSVVSQPRLTWPALVEAVECETCRPKAVLDFGDYTDAMAERIASAVSKVAIELHFS
ncbi:hypothetical protein C8Q79DRAFT_713602 [Trametes meyenii]|nr:hypothetical protein C8Q79DRAFT_713602 [Trametes meyenii]